MLVDGDTDVGKLPRKRANLLEMFNAADCVVVFHRHKRDIVAV